MRAASASAAAAAAAVLLSPLAASRSAGLGLGLAVRPAAAFAPPVALLPPRRSPPAAGAPPSSALRPSDFRSPRATADDDENGPAPSSVGAAGDPPRICVLGGGFGGLNAALTLSSLPWPTDFKPEITLVDPKERFVFLPLLYELCVEDATVEEVAPTYGSLLEGSGVEFARGEVRGIDADKRVVHTRSVAGKSSDAENGGTVIPYDALVVATGAQLNLDSVPGASEFALPFYTVEQCYELRRRFNLLDSMEGGRKARVVIVGGGYSGVELALNALERLGGAERCEVTLVHRGKEVLQYATEHNRRTGQDRLKKAGVEVLTETDVKEVLPPVGADSELANAASKECVVAVTDKRTGAESSLRADLLLWTAGSTSSNVPLGPLNSVLPRDASGRLVTGPLLRVKDHPDVFALGDCSRARKVPYAATAQVAMQQAPVAAWNVYATLMNSRSQQHGRKRTSPREEDEDLELLPFAYLDLGEMMTLGSDDATISSLGGLVELSGAGASVLRRLIYAVRMPTARQGLTAAVEGARRRTATARARAGTSAGRNSKGKGRKGKPIAWR